MVLRNYSSLENYITKEILSQSSKYLNEFELNVSDAIKLANKIVLNQLIDNCHEKKKLETVFENVRKIKPNVDSVLKNLSGTLGDNESITNLSNDFLDIFFDLKKDTYSLQIANETFIKHESSNAIIKMCSILILCYLAKNELNKNNIENHFGFEKSKETEIKNIISEKNQKPTASNVKRKSKINIDDLGEKKKSKKPLKIIFGVLFFIVLATSFCFYNENEKKAAVAKTTNEFVETQPQNIEGDTIENLGDFIDFTLPSDEIITIPENGVEKALLDLILDQTKIVDETSSYWLVLDRVHFENRETECKIDSEEQIKNLALIMTSFPKIEIKIACYTDNVGNPKSNLDLSDKRAQSLQSLLVKFGIQNARITTEGFGETFPIMENTNLENQKENRRIALKLTKK